MKVNSRPSRMVHHSPFLSPSRSPWISEWCAQVTVVPEQSRMKVFKSGKPNGSSTSMPFGGQVGARVASVIIWLAPSTTSIGGGNSAAEKKAQNQATKNITSE